MRTLIKGSLSLALLGGLLALTTATALAGGYAEALISGGDEPPTAGEEREVRVTLLQHGVTPVDWGQVMITATLPGTGERVSVPATSLGDGEWAATLSFPSAGDWQLRVVHDQLETPQATSFSVAAAPGAAWLPGAASLAGMLLAAVVLIGAARLLAGRGRPASVEAPTRRPVIAG